MSTLIYLSINTPIRRPLSWQETWQGHDNGLIRCWEIGRQLAAKSPELAERCLKGELPVLGWKGGVERKLKKNEKFGSLKYLAQWQGLRAEDLRIDNAIEVTLTCNRTGMLVTYTPDRSKYYNVIVENN